MYKEFERYFKIEGMDISEEETRMPLTYFLKKFNSNNFGNGIYRVFENEEIDKWKRIIGEAYSDLEGKFIPFAYDWLGRCFAIDERPNSAHKNQILLFEIGTADVLEIPYDIISFHNEEIPQNTNACLAKDFFDNWQSVNKIKLSHSDCVGYKIPLFLGGTDTIDNFEISDMEVYWHILSEIKSQIL